MRRTPCLLPLTRRAALAGLAAAGLPRFAAAQSAREIMWEDLIPPGVPYSEIIGEGEIDVEADFWNPVYDANATKLNDALNGQRVRMPGFIVPFDMDAEGVTEFMLVPYQGACIHVPPPPANQLVAVTSEVRWPTDSLWDAVWVTGTLRTQLQSTGLGQSGYAMRAEEIELYIW